MPIYLRLLLGYSAVLVLSGTISGYTIVQLGGLSSTARIALVDDTRRIGLVETLTDAFLSEVRYAGRYLISHTEELYEQYRQFNADFGRYTEELRSLASTPESAMRLSRIETMHFQYKELFHQEITFLQKRQPYGQSRYRQEREKLLETALEEMDLLKGHAQRTLHSRLQAMQDVANRARSLAVGSTVLLLGFGWLLSYRISKSITDPLHGLQRSALTPDGSKQEGTSTCKIPEIASLSAALRAAKVQLHAVRANNDRFVEKISLDFATPLISIKNRLRHLRSLGDEVDKTELTRTLIILTEETERLIERCQRVKASTIPDQTSSDYDKNQPQGAAIGRTKPDNDAAPRLIRKLLNQLRKERGRNTSDETIPT